MAKVTLEIAKERICSCNSCGALNYEPSMELMRTKKRVDTLYALQIGNMCSMLCADCVKEVIKVCLAADTLKDEEVI